MRRSPIATSCTRWLAFTVLASTSLAAAELQQHPERPRSWIAFRAQSETVNPSSPLGRDSVRVVDPDGGESKEVLSGVYGAYDPFAIQWAPGKPVLVTSVDVPKGQRMGLGLFPSLWVVDLEHPDRPTSIGGSTAEFAISPEGDRVAYVSYGRGGGSELEVRPLLGEGKVIATEGSWKVWEPSWSPDGRFVLHRAGLRQDGKAVTDSWGLYLLDVENGTRRRVAAEHSFARYLPDGRSLMVMDPTWPKGPKALHRLDLAAQTTSRIAAGLAPVQPALSPDGTRVACILANEEALDASDRIAIVALDGGAPREVARGRAPTWSPDGRRLAYERDGFVWVLDLESHEERKLVAGSAPSWSPWQTR